MCLCAVWLMKRKYVYTCGILCVWFLCLAGLLYAKWLFNNAWKQYQHIPILTHIVSFCSDWLMCLLLAVFVALFTAPSYFVRILVLFRTCHFQFLTVPFKCDDYCVCCCMVYFVLAFCVDIQFYISSLQFQAFSLFSCVLCCLRFFVCWTFCSICLRFPRVFQHIRVFMCCFKDVCV